MDKVMGEILQGLENKGLSENTIIIFMSDNGANPTGSNFPFRGNKGNLFEGGIRVPCIVKWPEKIKSGVKSAQPCITMDFTKSILRAANIEEPLNGSFEGIDILDNIEHNKQLEERTLFWRARRGVWTRKAVRHGDFKYIQLTNDKTTEEYFFDLKNDLSEKENKFSDYNDDVKKIKKLLTEWEEEVKPLR